LLPSDLLVADRAGAYDRPRYLMPRDAPWVREIASFFADLAGTPRRSLDDIWRARIEPSAVRGGASWVAARGIRLVLEKHLGFDLRAAADPRAIREHLFLARGAGQTREAALAGAARALDVSVTEVEDSLFADREGARVLRSSSAPLSEAALMERYNLALVEGFLLRASRVVVHVPELARAVVRYAKLQGLLAAFAQRGDGTMSIALSGPLALFHNTLKYGRALARFFPAVAAVQGYEILAACRVGDRDLRLRVAAGDPVERTHRLPRDHDSAVERAFLRDMRRVESSWTIARESVVLRAGAHLCFPDFTLTGPRGRVLLEIVGFYTDEYIAQKKRIVEAARADPLLLCIDDSLDCGEAAASAGVGVVRYHRRVDVAQALAVAELLTAGLTAAR
jgi:hypothetical protein